MNAVPEPNPNSPTWPIVLAFAKLMESKLALNRHKGDREGWMKDYPEALLDRVRDETGECLDAILMEQPESIALEAADIANFAMMVADSATNGTLLNARKSERDNL